MNLAEKTTEELKALWYDQFSAKSVAENNMTVINQELVKRTQEQQNEVPTDGND